MGNTTHDWAGTVDAEHLAEVRQRPGAFAPGGTLHLILAYAVDEAESTTSGGWTQRYEHGIPVTGLIPIDDDDTSGTTVHFLPTKALRTAAAVTAADLKQLTVWLRLSVEVIDQRIGDRRSTTG